jgi:sulfhydrogenase subunit beta (sulfur reductase)
MVPQTPRHATCGESPDRTEAGRWEVRRVRYLEATDLDRLIGVLIDEGYRVVAPTVRDGAVVLGTIGRAAVLPSALRGAQAPGGYRLERAERGSTFGSANGPDSAKRFLFPPREVLATIAPDQTVVDHDGVGDERPIAFLGLHACDLHAVEIQDRVFRPADPAYRGRRDAALLIGVDCAEPGATCFCASMGTGPRCDAPFDLALTEIDGGFVARESSDRGARVLDALGLPDASAEQVAEARAVPEAAARMIERRVDTRELPAMLMRSLESPRWQAVAERCLACSNCTDVCPTCFCHDVVDAVSISGDVATRSREWASCFSSDHSWVAGGAVRPDRSARYRQWLTHKFGTWVAQFGVSGCVGCGRCITWCPVGIDVTEELAALRAEDEGVPP